MLKPLKYCVPLTQCQAQCCVYLLFLTTFNDLTKKNFKCNLKMKVTIVSIVVEFPININIEKIKIKL